MIWGVYITEQTQNPESPLWSIILLVPRERLPARQSGKACTPPYNAAAVKMKLKIRAVWSRQTRGHFQTASPAIPLAPATKQNKPFKRVLIWSAWEPVVSRFDPRLPAPHQEPQQEVPVVRGARGNPLNPFSSPPFHILPDDSHPKFPVFCLKPQPYSFWFNDLRRNSARALERPGASRVKLTWLCVLEHRLGFSCSLSPRVFEIRRGVTFSHCVNEAAHRSQM